MIDYEAEAGQPVVVSDDELGDIAKLAASLVQWQRTIEQLEGELKRAKENARRIEEDQLPAAMNQLGGVGMSSFMLSSGQKLELVKALHMSVPKKNKAEVCRWAAEHGLGPLVRTEVSVDFGTGEAERAKQAELMLEAQGYDHVVVSTDINTGSLKAAVRELLQQGEDVPLKLFGAYEREYVKIS